MPERFGRYEVKGKLGSGGMATVYRAWDPRFHRDVAIKVISRSGAELPSSRARFEREARAVAALEHHAIVPVYDFGDEDDEVYFVMRLMNGGSLADRLAASGPMSVEDLAPIVERVAQALDYAHSRGVVHRDVKPGNILFDSSGTAFLSDFGIARDADQTSSLTGTALLGSPRYMAPEQAEGKPPSPASDIYSLGVTLYECLAGKPPFVADNPLAVLMMHMHDEVAPLGEIRPELQAGTVAAVTRAMRKDASRRPASALVMSRAFAPLAAPFSESMAPSERPLPFEIDDSEQRQEVWIAPTRVVANTTAEPPPPVGLQHPPSGTSSPPSPSGSLEAPQTTKPEKVAVLFASLMIVTGIVLGIAWVVERYDVIAAWTTR